MNDFKWGFGVKLGRVKHAKVTCKKGGKSDSTSNTSLLLKSSSQWYHLTGLVLIRYITTTMIMLLT